VVRPDLQFAVWLRLVGTNQMAAADEERIRATSGRAHPADECEIGRRRQRTLITVRRRSTADELPFVARPGDAFRPGGVFAARDGASGTDRQWLHHWNADRHP